MDGLSEYGKELYALLPGETHNDHILANYIKAIDENLDDDSVLRAIGERIGIFIPDDEEAYYILYYSLKEYIPLEKDPKLTEKIINMTFDEYKSYHPNMSNEQIELLFSNRLMN